MKDPDDRWDAHWISRKIDQRTLNEVLDSHVRRVHSQCRGNISMTALVLGVCRATMVSYARRFQLERRKREKPVWLTPKLEKTINESFAKIKKGR